MNEIWKDIKGHEGIYQISNLGNVKSLERLLWNGHTYYTYKERLLKKSINHNGYYTVRLSKNGKGKNYLLHRLLAMHFIPNPNNYPIINHKDGNKLNNNLDNLEWCTYKYNNHHAVKEGLNNVAKKIKAINIETGEELCFNSARDADKILNVGYKNISACLNGRQHTCGGYKWMFLD